MKLYMYNVIVEGKTKETARMEHPISATSYHDACLRANEFYRDEGKIVDIVFLYEITNR